MFSRCYSNESGNIFFALFGAVIIVGLLGTVVVSTMRGPLSTMVNVQTRTKAESEMDIASRLVLLEATQLANDGDCDSDGFVEPLEYLDAAGAGPTGGGFLPNVIASSRIDPWGIQYGYCAWDAGGTTNAIACDTDASGTNERLDGNGNPTDETYTVIAIISAGQDQVFQTVCNGGGSPSITKGGDDIVVEFTYGTAIAATNGLWNIKSGDPSTAEINKNLEVTGGASFTAGIDLTSSTAALQLGAASMLFPNETTLTTCNGANAGLIRIDTSVDPDILQICDAVNGWVPVVSSFWSAGAGDDIYYNSGTPQVGIGTTTPAEALDVAGNIALTGNLIAGGNLSGAALTATGNVTIGGTLGVTGATTLSALSTTGANVFAGTIDAQGTISSSTGDLSIGDNLVVTGTSDFQSTISSSTGDLNIGDNLIVTGTSDLQGAISDSTGNLTLNDAVDVTGAIDAQISISNSTGNLSLSDNVDVTGDLSVSGDVTGTNITASATLNAGTTISVNGDQLGPAINCAAAQKLVWTDGSGWSCDTDLQGGSGGGTPNLQDVLTTGNDAATLSAVNLGGVGIGTATPNAPLHIADSVVGGTVDLRIQNTTAQNSSRIVFEEGTQGDNFAIKYNTDGGTQNNLEFIGSGAGVIMSIERDSGQVEFSQPAGSYPKLRLTAGDITLPDYSSSASINDVSTTNTIGQIRSHRGSFSSDNRGGMLIQGFNDSGVNDWSPLYLLGTHSGTAPTVAAVTLAGQKWNGGTNRTGLSGSEPIFDIVPSYNSSTILFRIQGDGSVGIGTSTPATLLDVAGSIKIADGGEACAAGIAGAIRYNSGNLSYCNGTSWQLITSSGTAVTELNDLTDAITDYATDNNMFIGSGSGASVAAGAQRNTALGINTLGSLTTANNNTAFGYNALASAVDTQYNTAIGNQSLDAFANGANGGGNVGVGTITLTNLTSGWHNTAIGSDSLWALTSGSGNVGVGSSSLSAITSGGSNVAFGRGAGENLTGGSGNVFVGQQAGYSQTSGNYNIIIGYQANASNLTGSEQLNIGNILFGDIGTTSTDPKIGAHKYCDENLANCFLATDVSGGNSDIFEVTGAAGSEVVSSIDANVPYATADFVFGSPQLADDGNTNHDARMFFDKSKGAFRAGIVTGTQWDSASVGNNSAAFGIGTRASGNSSFASGNGSVASGAESVAMGIGATASTNVAVALGHTVSAGGYASVALGQEAVVTGVGTNSFAFGLGNATGVLPQVSSTNSFGIFMGDQSGVDITSSNNMVLAGGKMVIDPAVPATNLVADTALEVEGTLKIADGGEACAAGVAGALRYNTNTIDYCNGTSWVTLAASGTSGTLSSITAATATNTIANANYAQVWNWDTLTTETAMALGSTSITSGNILDINSSATAFTGTMADLTLSGDNAANTGTVLKSSVTGTLSAATPLMVTNAGTGASLRVNDDGTDTDTTPFIIDAAGNVGIGTSSPSSALYIANGDATINSGDIIFNSNSGGGNNSIYTTGAWNLALGTNGSARMTIQYDGNVGIGSSAPPKDLEIKESGGGEAAIRLNSSDLARWDISTADSAGEDLIFTRSAGAGDFVVAAGVNVGIGTAAPQASLDVAGAGDGATLLRLTTERPWVFKQSGVGGSAQLELNSTTDSKTFKITSVDGSSIARFAAYDADTSSRVIFVPDGGNVGIGTAAPQASLDVAGAGDGATLLRLTTERPWVFKQSGVGSSTQLELNSIVDSKIFKITSRDGSSIAEFAAYDADISSRVILVPDGGNVGINNAAPNVALDVIGDIEYTGTITDVSDRRLKENIKPLGDIIDRIAMIDTYSFTMKEDKNHRIEFGVMAQELEKIFPELVHTANDEMGTKSVNYIGLIAPMIEATKELKSENDQLKTDLENLKTAQNETNATLKEISEQVMLLNRAVGNNVGKASMQPYLLLLLGILMGMGVMVIIQRGKAM